MTTVRLTAAQALVRYLMAQQVEIDGQVQPLIPGIWAIFGHGNVAGLGEALYHVREQFPTLRAHNEQAMAHSAIAFAKAKDRRQLMACTTSIGPGATNMVTAAALAHVNRLPLLLLPGDTFATRQPDPVLQQVENFADPTVTANDCFRPVSRFWDRLTRPEQLLTSLPRAIQVLTDPVDCGPVTLAFPQDVQAMAYDYPEHFFETRVHHLRRPGPDIRQLKAAAKLLQNAQKPLIIAGGGVHYSLAREQLDQFATHYGIPVAETQAGKGALAWDHPCQIGSIGVTGSSAANELAAEADVILAVGTRLQDFTTASRSLFANPDAKLISLNVTSFDAGKHNSLALVSDAQYGLATLDGEIQISRWRAPAQWKAKAQSSVTQWNAAVDKATAIADVELPTDAQVVGAVNRAAADTGVVVCAAGGLPGELHKLWRTEIAKGYHLEYGFSCMGYEIAGGLGVKMALPDNDVFVMVGDGSYMMMNSEIATSVMLGYKLTIVILDNRGFGCINRLQQACGGAPFNNLLRDAKQSEEGAPNIDFAAHAAAMGASSEKVANLSELEAALERAAQSPKTYAIVIDTDPVPTTEEGGAWWDVSVPEVSEREQVRQAYQQYVVSKQKQDR
jgi:3D-(3,5/4)-trihydroxycyclohexane-1,2-dione acylhydrolase (decyclizing)